nr:hypothetical protein TorRG33x02_104160 [Ipomoea batatas]
MLRVIGAPPRYTLVFQPYSEVQQHRHESNPGIQRRRENIVIPLPPFLPVPENEEIEDRPHQNPRDVVHGVQKPPGNAHIHCSCNHGSNELKPCSTTYPTKTLAIAKNGQTRGLNKKEAIVDQSNVRAPRPSPFRPEPSWWAVTEFGNTQHTHEMLDRVWKMYPGKKYQQKLQHNAITKNFARDMRRRVLPAPPSASSPDDDIDDSDGISRAVSKREAGVSKDGDQHVLLHVKRARVQRELSGPEPGDPKLGGGQRRRHEPSDGESCHLDGDRCDDQRLSPVREKLVEK